MLRTRQQSSTAYPVLLYLVASADHVTPATGKTVTVTLSKNGGAFAAAAGTVSEIGNGVYALAGNATDRNTLGTTVVRATAADCDEFVSVIEVVPYDVFSRVDANATHFAGTAQTARDIGASVLLSPGTGTGQISLASGAVTAGTVGDKTGYSLAVAPPTAAATASAVRTELTTELGRLDAAITTRSTFAGGAVASVTGNVGGISGVTFPSGFSTLTVAAIQSGLSTLTAADVWSATTRTLTAGTNITLAKGTGITGFNDIAAADVWAVGTRTITGGSLTTPPPTAAATASAVRTELATELGRIDVATSTRLAPATAGRTLVVDTGGNAAADVKKIATYDVGFDAGRGMVAIGTAYDTNTKVPASGDWLTTAGYTAPPTAAAIATQVDTTLTASHGAGSWTGGTALTANDIWTHATRSLTDKAGFALTSAYDPAKTAAQAGDAMTLTSGEREAMAAVVESHLLNDGDSQMLINAIVGAIGNTNLDQAAVVAAIRADLERSGGNLNTLLSRFTTARAGYLDKLNVGGTLANTDNADTFKADVSGLLTAADARLDGIATAATNAANAATAAGQAKTAADAAKAAAEGIETSTPDDIAAAILATPANKLAVAADGSVVASNAGGGAGNASEVASAVVLALAGQRITLTAPILGGGGAILYAGDDYADERALTFTATGYSGPSLDNASVELRFLRKDRYRANGNTDDADLVSMGTLTQEGATVIARFEMPAAETIELAGVTNNDGSSDFVAQVITDSPVVTLWHGDIKVRRKIDA